MKIIKKLIKKIIAYNQFRKFYAKGNHAIVIDENQKEIRNPRYIENVYFKHIPSGGVKLIIHLPSSICKLNLDICKNAEIEIEKGNLSSNLTITKLVGESINKVYLGKNSNIIKAQFDITLHGNIIIGDDFVTSGDVVLKTDDTHPIFKDGNIVNKSNEIVIGNHCWIGMNALILKNCEIADNTIIGARSVVAGKFTDSNIVIAGSPAKIVKTGISWKYELIKYNE